MVKHNEFNIQPILGTVSYKYLQLLHTPIKGKIWLSLFSTFLLLSLYLALNSFLFNPPCGFDARLRRQSDIFKHCAFRLYLPWRHPRASFFLPDCTNFDFFLRRSQISLVRTFQRLHCCKTVVDREGIKGNIGNRETTNNPLIFKSKPESQT